MRGSTKKRGATWAYVVDLGTDHATGRRRQLYKRGFATKKSADEALAGVLDQINQRQFVRPAKGTLGAFLVDQWLPTKRHDLRESTWHSYDKMVRTKVVPAIGHIEVSKVDAATLETFYARLRTKGGHQGRPLAPKTVRNSPASWRRP